MYAIIGIVIGVLINHFVLKPIEVKYIQKEYKRNSAK